MTLKPARRAALRSCSNGCRPAQRAQPAKSSPPADPPPPAPAGPAALTPAQHLQVDVVALITEFLREVQASRQESRDILDHLAGKVAGLSADIVEMERAVARSAEELDARMTPPATPAASAPMLAAVQPPAAVPARLILRIWLRALVITGLFWGLWPSS